MTEAAVPTRRPGRPKGAGAVRRGAGSAFGHLVAACGLTYDEAAGVLGLSVQTVRFYGSGRLPAPPEVMDVVARLWEQVSYRIDPTVALPPAAAARRQALQDARTRSWRVKDRSPEKGDEDED